MQTENAPVTAKFIFFRKSLKIRNLLKTLGATLLVLHSSPVFSRTAPSLNENTLAANGEQHTILNIPTFGRYAVTVKSDQGTGLQLVDRMTGPGPINGKVGEKDGRLDLFLERGEYKIITHSHEKGSGQLQLKAHNFSELHTGSTTPRLIELKPVQTRLEDFQQISYWLEIKQRRRVAIEAAGRSLGDMRLWKDGDWLVDTLPAHKLVTPLKGKPLDVYQLNAYLEPGLYLLTFYGGPTQTWSEDSNEQPLYIRYGIPKLNVADRRSRRISPFGLDRWLIPKPSNYFRLELSEAKDAQLRVSDYQDNSPFAEGYRSAKIDKTSLPPAVEIDSNSNYDYQLVTVEGEAGQIYTLQHFEHRYFYSFDKEGDYWISTLHSGEGSDSVDATSILTARPYGSKERLLDTRTIEINQQKGFQRKFNLLDPLTLYLHVPQGGRYQVIGTGEGVEAKYKFEPFLTSRQYGYRSPPFRDSGYVFTLDAGYYVLSIEPKLKGILNLSIQPEGMNISSRETNKPSVASGTRYPEVELQFRTSYRLYINRQPGVKAGLVLRELPIDLEEGGLPVDQRSGEKLEIPVDVSEPGVIRALDINGQALPLSIDGGSMGKSAQVSRGQYNVTVTNPKQKTISYSLVFEPVRLAVNTPLPRIPKPDSSKKPNFPKLSSVKPAFFDLAQNQTATYNVEVTKPSLYRLETSGLLSTEGNIRTRTELSLFRRSSNGVGRNFLIQQYLREGDYQLSITPHGQSQGRVKLSLQQTKLIDNGQLTDGIVARYTLPADRGLTYGIKIKEAGRYRIRALGPGEERKIRLEDSDGWPLITPNTTADFEFDFKPGNYRLIVLPGDTDSRVISLLDKIPTKHQFEGHGPHSVPLENSIQHVWLEPEAGNQRQPDQWEFTLTAPADTHITLDNEMGGELLKITAGGKTESVTKVSATKVWQGRLEKGIYRLALRNERKNNRVEYKLHVHTEQLLPGQSREINLPGELSVSLGQASLMELSAFAKGDVRAWLYDDAGQLIAKEDDRTNDWNFLIARHLEAGQYRLRVEALDQRTHNSLVSFRIPQQKKEAVLILPATRKLTDDALHVFPIELPKDKTLLTVTADSIDTVGIALEVNRGMGWQTVGTSVDKKARLVLPLDVTQSSNQLRLRTWSVDRRGADIRLHVNAYHPKKTNENTGNAILRPLSKDSPFAVAAITVSRPGVFTLGSKTDVFASGQNFQALQLAGESPVAANAGTLWLATNSTKAVSVKVKRLLMQGEKPLQLTLPQMKETYVDVTAGDGPLLMLAESLSGQVGLQLLEQNQTTADYGNVSFSERGMISTLLSPGQARAKLWNGGKPGKALETTLRTYRFAKPSITTIAPGVTDSELPSMTARTYTLPSGFKHLQLALPAHTAVVLSSKGKIDTQYWSGDTPFNIGLDTQASQLTLLHTESTLAQIRLEINQLSDQNASLSDIRANRLYRISNARSGVLQIPVALPANNHRYTLRVRGSAHTSLLQEDGKILQGENLALTGSGLLHIKHEPGLIMAWLESREPLSASAKNMLMAEKSVTLKLHEDLPTQLLKSKQGTVLHMYSKTPLITRFHFEGGAEHVQAYPNGVSTDIYLPKGQTQLSISAISGQSLSGTLNLSTSPLIVINEGTGPERLLAGGGGQLFTFTLNQPSTIGIGLQASSDLIHGVLMNEAGEIIGQGVVQMRELTAGRYILAAYAPPEDQPIRIRPVLIGTQPKEMTPPIDVIRRYLQAAGVRMSEERPSQ